MSLKIFREIKTAVKTMSILMVLVCLIYPLTIWAGAQLVFKNQANGSLIVESGKVVGSSLIGQSFTSERSFHPRPSLAGKGYDATSSGGSNLGPISDKGLRETAERVANYRHINRLAPGVKVPIDAVTTSASGLDPHISPKNAELQALRVAENRNLNVDVVHKLIKEHTEKPGWGFLGESGVNVLQLNLALDHLQP
jgi:K+-transporting ATPase ATPase C chain